MIDPDIQVLLVAEAQNLSDDTLYAIDQFVMRGGRLMVMVDPWSEAMASQPNPTGMPVTDTHSDLQKLFKAWGIEFDPNEVVGDLTGAWRVRDPQDQNAQAVNYVAWFNIRDGINHNDPATADLQQVTVASSGFIAKAPEAKIDVHAAADVVAISPGLVPVDEVKMPDPAKILANFKPAGGPRVIAARVRGVLHSAFTGPPPEQKGQTRPANFPAYKAESSGPANLVVVADSDILADRFWVRISDFFGQQTATAVQRQRPVRRQPDRHAGRRRRADRPALRAATPATRSRWSTPCRRKPRRSSARPSKRCSSIWTTCRSNCRRCARAATRPTPSKRPTRRP